MTADRRALAPSTLAMLLERNGLPTTPWLRIKPAPILKLEGKCVARIQNNLFTQDQVGASCTIWVKCTWT